MDIVMGIGLASLLSVIGLESLCRPLDQSSTCLIMIECWSWAIRIFPALQALFSFFSLSYLGHFVIFLLLEQFSSKYLK